jgi:hypothetical protein
MINCNSLLFTRIFSHVKAHQDDGIKYGSLTRHAQLNCQMDYHAKKAIWETIPDPEAPTKQFPLEPICVYLGNNKLTSDKGERLKFWVQQQQARSFYHNADIIYGPQFNTIDWEMVHTTLCLLNRGFITVLGGQMMVSWTHSLCSG